LLTARSVMAVGCPRFAQGGRFPLSVGNALAEIGRCCARMRWSALTIVIVLSLAYVMNFSGQAVGMGTWVAGLGAAFVFLCAV
ncbi:L-lactate permease, partial [Micrococcus sp. SIMBA_131]